MQQIFTQKQTETLKLLWSIISSLLLMSRQTPEEEEQPYPEVQPHFDEEHDEEEQEAIRYDGALSAAQLNNIVQEMFESAIIKARRMRSEAQPRFVDEEHERLFMNALEMEFIKRLQKQSLEIHERYEEEHHEKVSENLGWYHAMLCAKRKGINEKIRRIESGTDQDNLLAQWKEVMRTKVHEKVMKDAKKQSLGRLNTLRGFTRLLRDNYEWINQEVEEIYWG
jgi:hypothetical protein